MKIHSLCTLSFRATDDEYEVFRRKMVLPSGPNGRVITARKYEFKVVEGRGRGLFLNEDVKAGDTILLEEPAVIGPKQMSPLVGTAEGGYDGDFLDEVRIGIAGLRGVPRGLADSGRVHVLRQMRRDPLRNVLPEQGFGHAACEGVRPLRRGRTQV